MSAIIEKSYTAEDLLTMPDGDRYELVDGQLVERIAGMHSSWIGGQLVSFLGNYIERNERGWVFAARTEYQCFPGRPNHVLKPSASFIRFGRFHNEKLPRGHCKVAPDLIAEVISPNDLYSEVTRRIFDFKDAGVPLIWVIDPDSRSVIVYRKDGNLSLLQENDQLSGESVLEGFSCKISDLFPPKPKSKLDSAAAEQNG